MAQNGKTIAEISVDARLLSQRLAEAKIGEILTYEELSGLISRDVRTAGYGALSTARHRCSVDHGFVFEPVRSKGLKRLSPGEIVETSTATLTKVRRAARRGRARLANVSRHDEKLPEALHVTQAATASVLYAIEKMATDSGVKKIANSMKGPQGAAELPIGKTLELMK